MNPPFWGSQWPRTFVFPRTQQWLETLVKETTLSTGRQEVLTRERLHYWKLLCALFTPNKLRDSGVVLCGSIFFSLVEQGRKYMFQVKTIFSLNKNVSKEWSCLTQTCFTKNLNLKQIETLSSFVRPAFTSSASFPSRGTYPNLSYLRKYSGLWCWLYLLSNQG